MYLNIAVITAIAVLLLIACYTDITKRDIPNWLNLCLALLAPVIWWMTGIDTWQAIAWQIGTAVAVFGFFYVIWLFSGIGGGDVKMLGAMALWITPVLVLPFLTVMAMVGGLICLVMVIRKWTSKNRPNPEVPYGLAIAAAGFWVLHQQFLNQFSLFSTI